MLYLMASVQWVVEGCGLQSSLLSIECVIVRSQHARTHKLYALQNLAAPATERI